MRIRWLVDRHVRCSPNDRRLVGIDERRRRSDGASLSGRPVLRPRRRRLSAVQRNLQRSDTEGDHKAVHCQLSGVLQKNAVVTGQCCHNAVKQIAFIRTFLVVVAVDQPVAVDYVRVAVLGRHGNNCHSDNDGVPQTAAHRSVPSGCQVCNQRQQQQQQSVAQVRLSMFESVARRRRRVRRREDR